MAGVLNIVFESQPTAGEVSLLRLEYATGTNTFKTVDLRVYWVNTRIRSMQAEVGNSISEAANNFITAIRIDYLNTGGDLNILPYLDTDVPGSNEVGVNISVEKPNWRWEGLWGSNSFTRHTISNSDPEVPKSITFKGYDDVESTCAYPSAIFEVTGGTGIYNVYIDGELELNSKTSPVKVPMLRNSYGIIRFVDTSGTTIDEKLLRTPRRLIPSDIKVQTANTPNGATITFDVSYVSSHLLPLRYSLDNTNFSEENVLTGQANGTYTVYVKDAFGCITSKVYTVDGETTVNEVIFHEPSVINPFRWAKVEGGKKNRYNTLSFNQLKDLAYPFTHAVVEGDEPVNQIKTNAKYLNIYAVDCSDSSKTYDLTPVKRSDHIGREFKSSAAQISTENNRLGLFFGAVDILDPLTSEVVGSKDFGFQIPTAFDKAGRFVDVEGFGKLPIQSILFDENYEAFILQFNVAYTGTAKPITASAQYNIQNYEIYEFITPISSLPENFNVVIEAGITEEDISHTYVSEMIGKVKDSHRLINVEYWNTTSLGDMNYATGVTHKIRLHSVLSRIADEQTIEGYNGDVERYNTRQEIFDGEEFIFGYLSDEMVRKLRAILAHDRLFINGVLYRLKESQELNSRFSTNLCELTAILSKGGDGTENFENEIIQPPTGEGVDEATYELENAIAAARNNALILWKKD